MKLFSASILILLTTLMLSLGAQTSGTTNGKLLWDQTAATLALAQGFTYKVYEPPDATTGTVVTDTCVNGSGTTRTCSTPLAIFGVGTHNIALTASAAGCAAATCESAKSASFTFDVNYAPPAIPQNPRLNGMFIVDIFPDDTFIARDDSVNKSGETLLSAATFPNNIADEAILMRFFLPFQPNAVVESATLFMTLSEVDDDTSVTNYKMGVQKVLQLLNISRTNGYIYDLDKQWFQPMAQSQAVGFADAGPLTGVKSVNRSKNEKNWVMTQMVSEWSANPSTNRGVLLNADLTATANHFRKFLSMNSPNNNTWPYLRIIYSSLQ
jgi:hypothetical protein